MAVLASFRGLWCSSEFIAGFGVMYRLFSRVVLTAHGHTPPFLGSLQDVNAFGEFFNRFGTKLG